MGKKVGPNFEDENRIREWAGKGKKPAEISDLLGIEEKAIKDYLDFILPKKAEVKKEKKDGVQVGQAQS